jgi:hypothetical protein
VQQVKPRLSAFCSLFYFPSVRSCTVPDLEPFGQSKPKGSDEGRVGGVVFGHAVPHDSGANKKRIARMPELAHSTAA